MKFEEQFPKLQNGLDHCSVPYEGICQLDFEEQVQKHCLSKQLVKEAIEKCLSCKIPGIPYELLSKAGSDLLKELGLDTE